MLVFTPLHLEMMFLIFLIPKGFDVTLTQEAVRRCGH